MGAWSLLLRWSIFDDSRWFDWGACGFKKLLSPERFLACSIDAVKSFMDMVDGAWPDANKLVVCLITFVCSMNLNMPKSTHFFIRQALHFRFLEPSSLRRSHSSFSLQTWEKGVGYCGLCRRELTRKKRELMRKK